jgi:hypothetical protein
MALSRPFVLTAALMAVIATHLPAQASIALTGKPQATLDNPFTSITALRELPGNKAVVVDVQDKTIFLVDFTKNRADSISRHGGGPGEYQMPTSAFAGPGDLTWVPDPMLAKIHVVSPDGKIRTTILPDEAAGLLMPRAADARGRFYFQGQPSFGRGGSGKVDSLPLLRWDPATKRTDTMAWLPQGGTATVTSSGGATRFSMRMMPYSRVVGWGALPDGRVVLVRPEPYRVDIVDAPGKVRLGPVNQYTPVKIGAKEREATRAAAKSARPMMIVRGGPGGGGAISPPPSAIPEIKDEDFPATMPPFQGGNLLIDPVGLIWVGRTRPADDKTPTYDIFDATGKLIGRAVLKPNSSIVGFGNGTIYIARQDPEDDLRYLERYARPGGAGDTGARPLGGGNR